MHITTITVSVDYSDFLVHALYSNYGLFDRWIVVTTPRDLETIELCKKYPKIELVLTNAFYERGIFNKYAGINEGLKLVPQDTDTWVLFLDSDIILQPDTPRVLSELNLDENNIYGIDRLNVSGCEAYEEYLKSKGILIENWLLSTAGLIPGARLVHYYGHHGENGRFEGWRPLGYFQLCHRSKFVLYPEDTLGADHEDLVFARQWPRSRRTLIPELYALHLESDNAHKAINWYGRKSGKFTLKKGDLLPRKASLIKRIANAIRAGVKIVVNLVRKLLTRVPPAY